MAAQVWFLPLDDTSAAEGLPVLTRGLEPGLARLAGKLNLRRDQALEGPWLLKIQLGAQHLPAAVPPAWVEAVAAGLDLPGRMVVCDTLSIQEAGLDVPADHQALARRKGFGSTGAFPYQVADDPQHGPAVDVKMDPEQPGPPLSVSALAAGSAGICVLNQLRPHPHLGLRGAVAALGLELIDHGSKLRLHADLKPRVDTPLCAGCGSCLSVCIWDAIKISGGRAEIDHQRCTGCGECMYACFLAGIQPEQKTALPVFQAQAAEAAWCVAAGRRGRLGFFNFLIRQGQRRGGEARSGRTRLGDVGVLASTDPVALDRATWDLVCERVGGLLQSWSGFGPDPGSLLARAEEVGLGENSYRLRTLD